ncbi:MAG TPA: hypothetical protein EYP53_05490 [Candidatus Latescibacteria bacterium]|nr:hypothetical protein [Candidatus Latescibacterota bacterium]
MKTYLLLDDWMLDSYSDIVRCFGEPQPVKPVREEIVRPYNLVPRLVVKYRCQSGVRQMLLFNIAQERHDHKILIVRNREILLVNRFYLSSWCGRRSSGSSAVTVHEADQVAD